MLEDYSRNRFLEEVCERAQALYVVMGSVDPLDVCPDGVKDVGCVMFVQVVVSEVDLWRCPFT